MSSPRITRPHFPPGYVEQARALLPWSHVEQRLTHAINYWLCTVRPDGRPHAVPKWAVWVDGKLYFDGSPATRHARNIATNPHVVIHLESGEDVVIVEGIASAIDTPAPEIAPLIAQAYATKYATMGYAPDPHQWDNGGLFAITPHTVIAWTAFTEDPTKFVL
ncbi:pyridoxamine 5'-phosphate oxidase family protein [Chloroflexus sp.]|uniref:pyridoxamine 5'-phosphate oxidase family protein n=1 Tax=Chloroflexus sp. TaxID=1904827 RepID=UPI00257A42ED|nr:pyridoxamine 5'-phosphate oxidase family protein [Chloroflexus sp.]